MVSRINSAAGHSPVPIDPETQQLFDFADRMHQQSGCLLAGAISTLLMLQQSQATPQVIQSLGLPVLWVDAAGQIHAHTA